MLNVVGPKVEVVSAVFDATPKFHIVTGWLDWNEKPKFVFKQTVEGMVVARVGWETLTGVTALAVQLLLSVTDYIKA